MVYIGDESAHYVAENLHAEIDRVLADAGKSSSDWPDALISAFATVDENLMDESETMMWTSGRVVPFRLKE